MSTTESNKIRTRLQSTGDDNTDKIISYIKSLDIKIDKLSETLHNDFTKGLKNFSTEVDKRIKIVEDK